MAWNNNAKNDKHRKHANGTRMSKQFLKRLDAGILLDRTKPVGTNLRPTVEAPKAMRKPSAEPGA